MEQIIEIRGRSVFTLAEAKAILPIIFRITKSYSERVEQLIKRIELLSVHSESANQAGATDLENQTSQLISEWQRKVERLGGLPKGLWIADFDSGDGYYCWKYPERTIEHWHHYSDGFSKRIEITGRSGAKSQNEGCATILRHELPTSHCPSPN